MVAVGGGLKAWGGVRPGFGGRSGGQSPWRPMAVPPGLSWRGVTCAHSCPALSQAPAKCFTSGLQTTLEGDYSHLRILPRRKQAQGVDNNRWERGPAVLLQRTQKLGLGQLRPLACLPFW